jgi:hypothetical protein
MNLFGRTCGLLTNRMIPFAAIGAGALGVYGVPRSTFDLDLLVRDPGVLDTSFWTSVDADADVRCGDADDPLRGVVRLEWQADRPVDVIVGRHAWQDAMLERAQAAMIVGVRVPVVTPADLVLLKLFAGGTQDRWDIEQLLAVVDVRADVDERVALLPADARELWVQLSRT